MAPQWMWLLYATVLAVSSAALVKPLFYPDLSHSQPQTPARYNYKYQVENWQTGDVKSQHERREGDRVEGYYSLVEPDGTRRTVKYTAGPHEGYRAVVYREPPPPRHTPVTLRTVILPTLRYNTPSRHGPVTFPPPQQPQPTFTPVREQYTSLYQNLVQH